MCGNELKVIKCKLKDLSDHLLNRTSTSRFISEVAVVNYSNTSVYLSTRDGLVTELPSEPEDAYRGIVVISLYTQNLGGDLLPTQGDECKINNYNRQNLAVRGDRVYKEIHIEIEEIKSARTGVYCHLPDIVLTTDERNALASNHPNNVQKLINDTLTPTGKFNPKTDVSVGFRLVDNSGGIGSKYIILNEKVFVLHGVRQEALEDGLLISGYTTMDTGSSNSKRGLDHYTMDQISEGECPFILYDNLASANDVLNNSDTRLKEIMENQTQRDHDKDLREKERLREITELKRTNKEAELKHQRELEMLDSQIETSREKASISATTNSQKGVVETLKLVGVTAAAVGTIYALYSRNK